MKANLMSHQRQPTTLPRLQHELHRSLVIPAWSVPNIKLQDTAHCAEVDPVENRKRFGNGLIFQTTITPPTKTDLSGQEDPVAPLVAGADPEVVVQVQPVEGRGVSLVLGIAEKK